jgi:hypothetical protein
VEPGCTGFLEFTTHGSATGEQMSFAVLPRATPTSARCTRSREARRAVRMWNLI